ncbi:MAG: MYXO-CTERM domain-containing protein [Myxococcota bacterium]|jgi:MYXO-CTERM domain-containing protein
MTTLSVFLLLAATAGAAEPPCYGFGADNRLEGEHFWIEWGEVGDEATSANMLQWAEEARQFYIDEMGYAFTDRTILLRIQSSPVNGGVCQTAECDDGDVVPVITLFAKATGEPGENTTKHEVAHAVQYAYMGAYLDAISSWPWWMEGSATWMATHAHGASSSWAGDVRNYLSQPWLALHQDLSAYLVDERGAHMYGTALLAQHLEDNYGVDKVRETWEVGGPSSGETILFPDVIAAIGLDWPEFWRGFMASVTVVDSTHANALSEGPFIEQRVSGFPDSGAPDEETKPQGYGLSIVKFQKAAGDPESPLEVTFEGDPAVPWLAVLVTTKGKAVDGKVQDIVPLEVGADGTGSAVLTGYDGTVDGWLVVSPQTLSMDGHTYEWSADWVADDTGGGAGKGGCGCATGGAGAGWLGVLGLFGMRRRR